MRKIVKVNMYKSVVVVFCPDEDTHTHTLLPLESGQEALPLADFGRLGLWYGRWLRGFPSRRRGRGVIDSRAPLRGVRRLLWQSVRWRLGLGSTARGSER